MLADGLPHANTESLTRDFVFSKSLGQEKELYFGLDFQGNAEEFWLRQITCEKCCKPTLGNCGKHRHKWHRANCQQAAGRRLSPAPMKVLHLLQSGTNIDIHCTQCYPEIHLRQPFWGYLTAQDRVLHHIFTTLKIAKKI